LNEVGEGVARGIIILWVKHPSTDRGKLIDRADKRDHFVIHLPFGVELLRCHSQLTVAVEVDQGLISFGERTGFHAASSKGSRSSSQAVSATVQAELGESLSNQMR